MNNLPCIQEQVGCRAYWNPDFLPSAHQSSSSALEVGFLHYRAEWSLIREEWAPAETCFLLSSLYSQPPLSERSRSGKNVSWYPNSCPNVDSNPLLSWGFNSAFLLIQFSSVQLLSRVRLFVTPWTAACRTSRSITNSQSLLKLNVHWIVMPSNHLILHHPLLIPPSIFPSIRVFSNGLLLFFCLN